jgi:hypothetical protein
VDVFESVPFCFEPEPCKNNASCLRYSPKKGHMAYSPGAISMSSTLAHGLFLTIDRLPVLCQNVPSWQRRTFPPDIMNLAKRAYAPSHDLRYGLLHGLVSCRCVLPNSVYRNRHAHPSLPTDETLSPCIFVPSAIWHDCNVWLLHCVVRSSPDVVSLF